MQVIPKTMKQEALEEILAYLTPEIDFEVLNNNLLVLKSETLLEKAETYFCDGERRRQLYGVNQFYHLKNLPYCDAAPEQTGDVFTMFPVHNPDKDFSLESLVEMLKTHGFRSFGVFRNISRLPTRAPEEKPRKAHITCLGLFAYKSIDETIICVYGFGYKKALSKVVGDEWACNVIQGCEEEVKELFKKGGYRITPRH
jgi:hypothetical protein